MNKNKKEKNPDLKGKQYIFWLWEISVVFLFYFILGTDWVDRYSKIELFLIAIFSLPVCILFHEFVHFLVMRLFTNEKVSFGIHRRGIWIKYIYVHTDGKLKKWQWILVKLAPIFVITVIPTAVMLFTNYRSMLAYSFVMLNFAASYYDIIDAICLCKERKRKVIHAELQKSRIEILRAYKEYDVDHEETSYLYSFTMNNEVPELLEEYNYSEYMKGLSHESDGFVFRLLNFVSEHFYHNGGVSFAHNRRLVDIIAAYEQNGKKTNCRGLSMILAELLRINGIKARHVTCKPFEEPFNDCHVVVDCILPSGKRIMLDPAMRLYLKDEHGEYVSIERFRKGLIEGETFFENEEASHNGEKFDKAWYMEYMSKNLFRFSAGLDNADAKREDERREIELIPKDYQIKGFPRWKVFVYNPLSFWKI